MTEENNTATEEAAKELTISIDGVDHALSTLSPEAQNLVAVHQSWSADLQREQEQAQTRISQLQAALQAVSSSVVERVKADQAAADAPAEDKAEATADATGTPDAG